MTKKAYAAKAPVSSPQPPSGLIDEGYPDWPTGWTFPGPPWPPGWDEDLYNSYLRSGFKIFELPAINNLNSIGHSIQYVNNSLILILAGDGSISSDNNSYFFIADINGNILSDIYISNSILNSQNYIDSHHGVNYPLLFNYNNSKIELPLYYDNFYILNFNSIGNYLSHKNSSNNLGYYFYKQLQVLNDNYILNSNFDLFLFNSYTNDFKKWFPHDYFCVDSFYLYNNEYYFLNYGKYKLLKATNWGNGNITGHFPEDYNLEIYDFGELLRNNGTCSQLIIVDDYIYIYCQNGTIIRLSIDCTEIKIKKFPLDDLLSFYAGGNNISYNSINNLFFITGNNRWMYVSKSFIDNNLEDL